MNGDNTNVGENTTVPMMATPNVVPKPTPVIAGHGEKPEKFNGSDFKRWQQKMLFYLTTLNLAACNTPNLNYYKIENFDIKFKSFNISWG